MASNRMNASFVLSQLEEDFDESGSDGSDIELENVGVDTLDGMLVIISLSDRTNFDFLVSFYRWKNIF